jgi:hypothetical protein
MDKIDLLQGTLDMLILRVLARGEMHGWGIVDRMRQLSRTPSNWEKARFTLPSIAWRPRAGSRPNGRLRTTTARRSIIA